MSISVVIPALNEEAMIKQCLESIRRQQPPVELILIDNGSTDHTADIAETIADKVYRKPGLSLAEMRDFGAREAKGEIIVTTDADCIIPDGWITRITEPFKDPDIVAVGSDFRALNDNAFSRFYCWISPIMQRLGLFQGANMAYRKEAYLRSEGYADAKRAEDWHLSFNLGKVGKTKYVPGAWVNTEIPLNRQIEYPGVIVSAFLLIIGAAMGWMNLVGFGIGYIGSELVTFVYRYRGSFRRSHMALALLVIIWFLRSAMKYNDWLLTIGTVAGIFGYHVISEDLRYTIEDLKLYKLRKEPDPSFEGFIKKQLIKFMDI